jgi:hypothetical protein
MKVSRVHGVIALVAGIPQFVNGGNKAFCQTAVKLSSFITMKSSDSSLLLVVSRTCLLNLNESDYFNDS